MGLTKEQRAEREAAEAIRRAPGFGMAEAEIRTMMFGPIKPKRKSRLGKALAAWVESCGPQEHQPIHGLTGTPYWGVGVSAQPLQGGAVITGAGYYGQSVPPNYTFAGTLTVSGSLTANGYTINSDPVK